MGGISPRRIGAFSLRYLYLYKRSFPRLLEIFYWPIMSLLLWGFITVYLARFRGALPDFVAFLIGALILWDILFRSQQGVAVSFLEDLWSRNLINIFVSPLGPAEYVLTLLLISFIKLVMTTTLLVILAWIFYSFDIFTIGFSLIPFIANLIVMGWSVGIMTTAVILRYGREAEVLAWGVAFFFQPISAVFYPVEVLPGWLQNVAWALPSAHVFEGMRAVITTGVAPVEHLVWAGGLNVVYTVAAALFFSRNFRIIKEKGLLAKAGD